MDAGLLLRLRIAGIPLFTPIYHSSTRLPGLPEPQSTSDEFFSKTHVYRVPTDVCRTRSECDTGSTEDPPDLYRPGETHRYDRKALVLPQPTGDNTPIVFGPNAQNLFPLTDSTGLSIGFWRMLSDSQLCDRKFDEHASIRYLQLYGGGGAFSSWSLLGPAAGKTRTTSGQTAGPLANKHHRQLHPASINSILQTSCSLRRYFDWILDDNTGKDARYDPRKSLFNESSTWLLGDFFLTCQRLQGLCRHYYYDDVQERSRIPVKGASLPQLAMAYYQAPTVPPPPPSALRVRDDPSSPSDCVNPYADPAMDLTYVPISVETGLVTPERGEELAKAAAAVLPDSLPGERLSEWKNSEAAKLGAKSNEWVYEDFVEQRMYDEAIDHIRKMGVAGDAEMNVILNPYHPANLERVVWKHASLHDPAQPPPLDNYYMYYTLLLRLNYAYEKLEKYKNKRTEYTSRRLEQFIAANARMLAAAADMNDWSDSAFLRLIPAGETVPIVYALYPFTETHHVTSDADLYDVHVYVRSRPSPSARLQECFSSQEKAAAILGGLIARAKTHAINDDAEQSAKRTRSTYGFDLEAWLNWFASTKPPSGTSFAAREVRSGSVFSQWQTDNPVSDYLAAEARAVSSSCAGETSASMLAVRNTCAILHFLHNAGGTDYDGFDLLTRVVFGPFGGVVDWIAEISSEETDWFAVLDSIVGNESSLVATTFGKAAVESFTAATASVEAGKLTIVRSIMLRVFVAETLRKLCAGFDDEFSFVLGLFADTHLDLATHCAHTGMWTDAKLRATERVTSPLEFWYPHPTRVVHSGTLPDLSHSYETLTMFAASHASKQSSWQSVVVNWFPGASTHARTAGERSYENMIRNDSFAKWTAGILEVALKGSFIEAGPSRPDFANRLKIHAVSQQWLGTEHESFLKFVHERPDVIGAATREAIYNQLRVHAPAFHQVICEGLPVEAAAVEAKLFMDTLRSVFDVSGELSPDISAYVDQMLHRNTLLFRDYYPSNGELDESQTTLVPPLVRVARKQSFASFANGLFENYDMMRYTEQNWLTSQTRVPRLKQMLLQRYVESLVPGATTVPDLQILYHFGITTESLALVRELLVAYRADVSAHHVVYIVKRLYETKPVDYVTCSLFFEYLHAHSHIRLIELEHAGIVQQQLEALCRRYDVESPSDLPPTAGYFSLAPCCRRVKTLLANGKNRKAMGNVSIIYNVAENRYVCGKKREKNETLKQFDKVMRDQFDNTAIMRKFHRYKEERLLNQNTKSEVQKFAELVSLHRDFLQSLDTKDRNKIARIRWKERKQATCIETDIIFVPLVGRIIELEGYKEAFTRSNHPDRLPFWINPCCGQFDNYIQSNWGANGYTCTTCKASDDKPFAICELCHKPGKRDASYSKILLYDDEVHGIVRACVVCSKCKTWDMTQPGYVVSFSDAKSARNQKASSGLGSSRLVFRGGRRGYRRGRGRGKRW